MCQALREIMKEDFEAAETRGMEKGLEQGREQGREQGENQLGSLITKLKELGRTDDVFKAAADKKYRDKLYKEFKMA